MIKPTLEQEKKLWKSGHTYIGGIDEAGRGSWAGPVVAAVVVLPSDHRQIDAITDSKLVSPAKRSELYETITDMATDFGIGIVGHQVVDKIGILNATKQAAKEAVEMLRLKPDYLLCDALDLWEQMEIDQEAIIKGDQKVYSISCASIIAKVTRDNLMSSLGGEYTKYQFEKHKGYGTKLHQEMLHIHGVSDIHRRSYRPIKEILSE